jgi:hypothetical protein
MVKGCATAELHDAEEYLDMATSKDFSPNLSGWIHDLARAETHPDAERLLGLGSNLDPHQIVEEETVRFLSELRERFNEFSRIFNSYSEAGVRFAEMKIYSVAQTAADFMLYRNQVKLVVSNAAHGVISLAFAHHARGPFGFDGANPDGGGTKAQELLARIGPFRDVKWTFQGEEVKPEQIAKYYFAEFIRATREKKASTGQNQALLEQIKALLGDNGIQL